MSKKQVFFDADAVNVAYNNLGYYTNINGIPGIEDIPEEERRSSCNRAMIKVLDGSVAVYKLKEKQGVLAL